MENRTKKTKEFYDMMAQLGEKGEDAMGIAATALRLGYTIGMEKARREGAEERETETSMDSGVGGITAAG